MQKFFFVILCFLMVSMGLNNFANAACESGDGPRTGSSLTITVTAGTPNGGTAEDAIFTYSFGSNGKDCNCGQFANGDYWIAPADNETEVTITSISTTSVGKISADADPLTEDTGLLDGSNKYGNYDATEEVIAHLPVTYSTITSLVTAIQRNEDAEGNCGTSAIVGECVDAYNVLTILPNIPPNGGSDTIRPNITGETKEVLTLSDFNFDRLTSLNFLTGTDSSGFEKIRQRWSHSTEIFALHNSSGTSVGYCSEGGRAFRSHILIDDYAAGVARQFNDDLMIMFSDENTYSEKKAALAAMITYGLDLYHAMYDAPKSSIRYWGTGAGQHLGKFLPPVFMAALSNRTSDDNDLMTTASKCHDTSYSGPQELTQIWNLNGTPVWGDQDYANLEEAAYWQNLVNSQLYDTATGTGNINYGSKAGRDPYGYIDGPANLPGEAYMVVSLGPMRSFVAAMNLMPMINSIVNYPDLRTYVNRVEDTGLTTINDPCVTPDTREDLSTCEPWNGGSGCVYYGITWGPTDPKNPDGTCITTVTDGYTEAGRFKAQDGKSITPYYTSYQVEKNWNIIRTLNSLGIPKNFRISE